jgi:protein gp37
MWGPSGFRYETANWERSLHALNRKAAAFRAGYQAGGGAHYTRPRVFINSLSDTFEDWQGPVYRLVDGSVQKNQAHIHAQSIEGLRRRFFQVAEECTELDLLLLTKRPENVLRMAPLHWLKMDGKWPAWVWIGTTVEDQEHADKRIPELLKVPTKVRFLSVEPLLGKVDLGRTYEVSPANGGTLAYPLEVDDGQYGRIHWVIVGGESGTNARPMHPDWVRKVRDQCVAAGVPFFFKQWGEWLPFYDRDVDDPDWRNVPKTDGRKTIRVNLAGGQGFHGERVVCSRKVGKKNAGRVLDGRTWDEVPR